MIWRLLLLAERHFRKLHAAHLAGEVYRGVTYVDGIKVTKTNPKAAA
jgi:hypothetical protein